MRAPLCVPGQRALATGARSCGQCPCPDTAPGKPNANFPVPRRRAPETQQRGQPSAGPLRHAAIGLRDLSTQTLPGGDYAGGAAAVAAAVADGCDRVRPRCRPGGPCGDGPRGERNLQPSPGTPSLAGIPRQRLDAAAIGGDGVAHRLPQRMPQRDAEVAADVDQHRRDQHRRDRPAPDLPSKLLCPGPVGIARHSSGDPAARFASPRADRTPEHSAAPPRLTRGECAVARRWWPQHAALPQRAFGPPGRMPRYYGRSPSESVPAQSKDHRPASP
jgi:hypothetical protein